MFGFTEDERDLVKETFNVGVGRAAAGLSELVDDRYEIRLSVPHVSVLTARELVEAIAGQSDGEVCAVTQAYEGVLTGTAMLVYSVRESLTLVGIMLGESADVEHLGEVARDALREVGNILLNDTLAALADLVEAELVTQLPEVHTGTCDEVMCVLAGGEPDAKLLHLEMDFALDARELNGHLGLSLGVGSAAALRDLLRKHLVAMGI